MQLSPSGSPNPQRWDAEELPPMSSLVSQRASGREVSDSAPLGVTKLFHCSQCRHINLGRCCLMHLCLSQLWAYPIRCHARFTDSSKVTRGSTPLSSCICTHRVYSWMLQPFSNKHTPYYPFPPPRARKTLKEPHSGQVLFVTPSHTWNNLDSPWASRQITRLDISICTHYLIYSHTTPGISKHLLQIMSFLASFVPLSFLPSIFYSNSNGRASSSIEC